MIVLSIEINDKSLLMILLYSKFFRFLTRNCISSLLVIFNKIKIDFFLALVCLLSNNIESLTLSYFFSAKLLLILNFLLILSIKTDLLSLYILSLINVSILPSSIK